MKKIQLREIRNDTGYDLDLNSSETWLTNVLDAIITNHNYDKKSLKGHIHLDKVLDNVNLFGDIQFSHTPLCARCGEELAKNENITLQANFAPLTEERKGKHNQSEEEELEITDDDIDFAFYEGDDIDIAPVVRDEITLGMPYNFYCEDEKACEKRLEALLNKKTDGKIDPRFAVLKDFKVKN